MWNVIIIIMTYLYQIYLNQAAPAYMQSKLVLCLILISFGEIIRSMHREVGTLIKIK